MSITPRTDAAAYDVGGEYHSQGSIVSSDFARQLERENAALREEVAELREISSENLTELVSILDEYELSIGPNVTLRQVLDSLTAERDRLKAQLSVWHIEKSVFEKEFARLRHLHATSGPQP